MEAIYLTPFVAAGGGIEPHEITVLFGALGLMLLVAKLLGEIAKKLGQPAILGEILAGVLLGKTVLGSIAPHWYESLFPATGNAYVGLSMLITVSVALLLLVAGLEVDLTSVVRQGKATVMVSIAGMLVPFAMGLGLAYAAPNILGRGEGADMLPFALFVGIAMSITALPVIAKILLDLNMSKSDLGMLIMSSAMVNDLVGWIGFAIVLAMIAGGSSGVGTTILLTFAFVIGMLTVFRWLSNRCLPIIQAHTTWPGGVLSFVLISAMLCSAVTEAIGIHAIFGAFIAGVAIGDSRHLRQRTRETIHEFITNIFAPLFFASIGLRVSFVEHFDLTQTLIVLVIAIAGKVIGCYFGAKWSGIEKRQSWAIGFGMAARGAMEVILAELARSAGLIDDELFVAIVIMALVTSLISGPMMQRLLNLRQQRKISDYLTEKQFMPQLKARTPRAVIEELAARTESLTDIDKSVIAAEVWRREQLMSTGVGNEIAVPHARLAKLEKPLLLLGRSEAGVDFDAPDGIPARLIFMLLTPAHDQTSQLEMLSVISRTFISDTTRAEALNAANFTELLAAVSTSASENNHG